MFTTKTTKKNRPTPTWDPFQIFVLFVVKIGLRLGGLAHSTRSLWQRFAASEILSRITFKKSPLGVWPN
jgi:hypothetical protein